ncbi:MAG: Arginine repressor [Gemmatimonadetes bacterium]|nr:Arginine repressor [Gemmatimonadota bacterium]
MASKNERQQAILELIQLHEVASQEELRRRLLERGVSVTQATLSRDLHELGVARVPTEEGARYSLPESMSGDEDKPNLGLLLPQLFSDVDGVGELVVLHTVASGAQPIAEAIDAEGWPEVLGTIAGENTILLICRSAEARMKVIGRIRSFAQPVQGTG